MKEAFARIFDESACRQVIAAELSGRSTASSQLIGEGAFFRVFRVATRGKMELVVKILKPKKELPPHWERNISKVQTLNLSMVPPMRVLKHPEEGLSYVMPYGNSSVEFDIHTQEWRALTQDLAEQGLILNDTPQVRAWNNIPFIVDWSDLSTL